MAEMSAENNLKSTEEKLSFGELSALTSAKYRRLQENEKRWLESIAAATNASETPSLFARSEQYKDDVKKMKKNLKYMMTNYNTHSFLVTYTDTMHEELFHPNVYSNSSMTAKSANFINKTLYSFSIVSCLRRMVLDNSAVCYTSAAPAVPEQARKRTKTDLKKSLQIAVVAAFNNVSKRKYKCVPRLSLFDDTKMRSLGVRMVGWPIDILPPILGGKTSFDVYDGTDSLEALLQGFQNKTIIFEKT